MGTVSTIVYVLLSATSTNLIADAFTSLALTIAFYYGITGFACVDLLPPPAVRQREELRLHRGAAGRSAALILTCIFVKAVIDYSQADGGYCQAALRHRLADRDRARDDHPRRRRDDHPADLDARVLQAQARGRRPVGARRLAPAREVHMSSGVIVGYDGSDVREGGAAHGDRGREGVRRRRSIVAFGYEVNPVGGRDPRLPRRAARSGPASGSRRRRSRPASDGVESRR